VRRVALIVACVPALTTVACELSVMRKVRTRAHCPADETAWPVWTLQRVMTPSYGNVYVTAPGLANCRAAAETAAAQ